jgi:hypothetical protein
MANIEDQGAEDAATAIFLPLVERGVQISEEGERREVEGV